VFGVKAILPLKFEVPSLRIAIDERFESSQSLKDGLERLKGLSEVQRLAAQHVETSQKFILTRRLKREP
jgi:hypothetical protein